MCSDTTSPSRIHATTRFFVSGTHPHPTPPKHFRLEAIISKSFRRKRRRSPRVSGATPEIPWYWLKPED